MQSIALAKGFQAYGWETKLLTFRPGGPLSSNVKKYGISWECLQPLDLKANWLAPGLVSKVNQCQPDTVLLMGREANCHGEMLKKHFPGIKIAGTVRTGRKLTSRYRQSLASCDLIICNSEWSAKRLGSIGEEAHIIHNGLVHDFNLEKRELLRELTREKLGATPGTTVFLLCAAFRKGKNHIELLEILEGLEGDWSLWLAGSGRFKYPFFKKLQNFRFRHRVKDAGQIFELDGLYAGSDIGILPSLEESLPNFLVECQSWGIPVAAYNCAGNKEAFVDGETGILISPGEPDAFRDGLSVLMNNQSLREEMSVAAKKFAQPKFGFKERLADYISLLQDRLK